MRTHRIPTILAIVAVTACGGTIDTRGDGTADGATDTSPDVAVDTAPDGAPDTPGDGLPDLVEEPLPECGDERGPTPETFPVVNGSPTWDSTVVDLTDGQALAVGALMQRSSGSWSSFCTATLVTPTLVLTAAHCIRSWGGDLDPDDVRFAVGDDVASPVHMYTASDTASHSGYSPWGGDAEHDVGVVVLDAPATDAVPTIEPIPMNCAALDSSTFMHEDVQNVGYGSTVSGGGGSNTQKWWTVEEVIDLSGVDFTVDGHGYSSVCYGDSGGPSLWTMPDGVVRVVGTVSYGDPSCMDEDHFARVDDSCPWLLGFVEDCGDVGSEGYCDGDTAIWCESGSLMEVDCSVTGRTCGDDGSGNMRCLDPPDPCDGETWEGRCDGDTAIWCEDESVVSEDCASLGLVCGGDGSGLTRCITAPDPCAELGWEGMCDGPDAVWCEGGVVRTRRCDDCFQECGWVEEIGGYYCIDPE